MNRFDPQRQHDRDAGHEHDPVVIRRARDADAPLLDELAALDSARPLQGTVLVAVVDERIWAALALDDGRAIADPFLPTAAAVELLALRVKQLRAADRRTQRGMLPRWIARRVRA
ncbi:MAG: hypothetical protein Q8O56_12485 [Solirubrobacteraceae bacterium]|nr:hypothetical protein [Solirubrobacteraceae bacterium]